VKPVFSAHCTRFDQVNTSITGCVSIRPQGGNPRLQAREEALENDCTHIVFEQLKGIRERLPHAKAVHKWAFHRLYEYVTYKAESEGLEVKQINPAYTSQRCSKCGFTHEDNRPHNNGQDKFGCLKCGYEVHADYNAAKNIGLKYLRDQQKSGRGGAPVGVCLNSGTLNVNGEHSPTALSS